MNRTKWSKYDELIVRLYTTTNKSMPEVAKEVGMPYDTLKKRLRRMGVKGDRVKSMVGRPKSEELKEKLSKPRFCTRGSSNPNWRGGIAIINHRRYRVKYYYQTWTKKVFERDGYICQGCGIKGGNLEGHHILPVEFFPEKEYEISNGITLCKKCHNKVHYVRKYKEGELLGTLRLLRSKTISSQARRIVIIEVDEKVHRLTGEENNPIIQTRVPSANVVCEDIVRTI